MPASVTSRSVHDFADKTPPVGRCAAIACAPAPARSPSASQSSTSPGAVGALAATASSSVAAVGLMAAAPIQALKRLASGTVPKSVSTQIV